MAIPEPSTAARRSWFVPFCASTLAWLALAFPGCLNPMPEEFPSERDRHGLPNTSEAEPNGAAGGTIDYAEGGATGSGGNDSVGGDPIPGASPEEPLRPPAPEAPGESDAPSVDAPDAGVDAGSELGTLTDTAP